MVHWNDIVQANAANVLNAAYRVIGNLADAEDVCQDVFAEAFQKWDAAADQQWAGLLRRMSVCRSIDFLRSRKQSQSLDQSVEMIDLRAVCPSNSAICSELQQRVRELLTTLSDRESQVFCLVFFEQQEHEEIASMLGIKRTAVATALSKARTKIEYGLRKIPSGESK